MEANKVAFVSTVHVSDDPNGEGFGIAHYVGPHEKRLTSDRGDDCPYGPRDSCTIDTNRPFTVRLAFSPPGSAFEYDLVLEQEAEATEKPQVNRKTPPLASTTSSFMERQRSMQLPNAQTTEAGT